MNLPETKPALRRRLFRTAAALALATLSSCGKQAFQVVSTSESQSAPGNYTVPPKVDIILAEENTGAAFESYTGITSQVPAFLSTLEASGWDYHFAAIPLATAMPITQAFASHYDSNWGSQWISPYPGAQQWITGPGGQQTLPSDSLSTSVFTIPTAGSNTGFIQAETISNAGSGTEQGFQTILTALTSGAQGTGIVRPDALLVVMTLAITEDTSLVNICTRADSKQGPCDTFVGLPPCKDSNGNDVTAANVLQFQGQQCGTSAASFAYYQQHFQVSKNAASQFQFYSAVAAESEQGHACAGGNSFIGTRYTDMASVTGGANLDICTQPFGSMLSTLGANLQTVKLSYQTAYLFISQVPQVPTITVTKYLGGNTSQAMVIPKSATNGWTYAGQVSNVDTIDYPVPMDQASGIAIQLHGSAQLVGADTASVTYTPAGATNTISN